MRTVLPVLTHPHRDLQVSFETWLRTQRRRPDPVGDIARELIDDRCWDGCPASARNHIRQIHRTLIEELVMAALRRAVRAYHLAIARDCNHI